MLLSHPKLSTGNHFDLAIRNWENALAIDPNQYIWRRRIQQFGPILEKPYPFYDWVPKARKEILARGETPKTQPIFLTESELASPRQKPGNQAEAAVSPDPSNSLTRDFQNVDSSISIIPSKPKPGDSFRVFINLSLKNSELVSWNNESLPAQIYIPKSDFSSRPILKMWRQFPNEAHSDELRIFDFELQMPIKPNEQNTIECFVVVDLCDKKTGLCFSRRIDLTFLPAR